MPDASELYEPLENTIRDQLIPALVGQEVSDAEGQILAFPLRHGGLGLTDPRETAKMEYEHSTQITNKLTDKIYTKARSRLQPLGPAVHQTHKKQYTTREKCKMQKHP